MKLRSYTRVSWLLPLVCCLAVLSNAHGQETVDLTQPHNFQDPDDGAWLYNIGPTGMIGLFMGGHKGHQIHVRDIAKGSPADGRIELGDVILGVNGKPFKKEGENLIETIGNAINEAEKVANGGKITFTVWRDANFKPRRAAAELDIKGLDIHEFFKVVEADNSADLLRYKTEQQVQQEAKMEWKQAYEKFPIKASTIPVTLQLQVMGSYSPASPWDCPKVAKIREQAYPHLEDHIQARGLRGWRAGTVGLALLASGKPEHMEMVRKAVHKNKRWLSGYEPGDDGWGGGYKAWYAGYELSFLGEYYHRTKDKDILPGLAAVARGTAKIQAYGGTWGHSHARRSQNYGMLHGPAPGYGAMNQAAGPCFYGLTLAQMAGINEPIVDDAIRRSTKFYSTFVDKGTVPYGFHPPGMYEDSNGKNGPPALAMRILGENYKAKYFSLSCAVASGWGYRGGHGDGTFGNYWPQLASSLAGKEAVIPWMKRMQPYYTMLRRFDGTFVSISHGMNGGIGCQFDPTAMYTLHYSIPMAKLYMTGRDPVPEIQATPRDIQHLKDRSRGFPWQEYSTDELLDRLDTFSTEQRRKKYVVELVKRFKAGETDIESKLLKLIEHDNQRVREAALYALTQCGRESATLALPGAIECLHDPSEIVRMAAVSVVDRFATVPGQEEEQKRRRPPPKKIDLTKVLEPLFNASLKHYPNDTNDNVNTPYVLMKLLINTNNPFAHDPFAQGQDPELVRRVLERFLSLDPREHVMGGPSRNWDRETCVKIAGPLMFTASNRSKNGIMFSGGALSSGQSLLLRHKFVEGIEAGIMDCNKIARVRRELRPRLRATGRSGGWLPAKNILKYRGVGKDALPWMLAILVERPNLVERYAVSRVKKEELRLSDAIQILEENETPQEFTSLRTLAMNAFFTEVDAIAGQQAQVAHCRKMLEPERKTYYRQMAAMSRLVELLGSEAVKDLGPYLNHQQWRFREHSRQLLMNLKADGTGKALAVLAASNDERVASGALIMLGARSDREGVAIARKRIGSDSSPLVRGAAAHAMYGGSDGEALKEVLDFMKRAHAPEELEEYEKALLLGRTDKKKAEKISGAAKAMIPDSSIRVRRSLYYVLGQLGGKANLAYLKDAAATEIDEEFRDVCEALSWSPDIDATNPLVEILVAHQGTERALVVSGLSVKRMINGGEKLGKVPDEVNLDFAETHLQVVRNLEVLGWLGEIHRGRSLNLLLKYMKLGPGKVTATAGRAIGRAAAGLSPDLPREERKAAAEILTQLMEYIHVVYLRHGPLGEGLPAHAKKHYVMKYAKWKSVRNDVGEVLRRIYKPEEEGVDDIDMDDIDI